MSLTCPIDALNKTKLINHQITIMPLKGLFRDSSPLLIAKQKVVFFSYQNIAVANMEKFLSSPIHPTFC